MNNMNNIEALEWLKENNGVCSINSLHNELALIVSVNGKVTQVALDSSFANVFLEEFVIPTIESIK